MIIECHIEPVASASQMAQERMRYSPGKPLFVADWDRALMIHYEVDPRQLQALVPFKLDLREGSAFVSLVAFTMNGMRPWYGGRQRFFRVWHLPWAQVTAEVKVIDQSLIERSWPLFRQAKITGANFSPGVRGVWMGRPIKLREADKDARR